MSDVQEPSTAMNNERRAREARIAHVARAMYEENPFKVITEALVKATGLPMGAEIPLDAFLAAGGNHAPLVRLATVAVDTLSASHSPEQNTENANCVGGGGDGLLDTIERALFDDRTEGRLSHIWDDERARAMRFEADYPGYLKGRSLITDVIRDAAVIAKAIGAKSSAFAHHPTSTEAGLEQAARWHDERAKQTPDVFEQELHEVSARSIRHLIANQNASTIDALAQSAAPPSASTSGAGQ